MSNIKINIELNYHLRRSFKPKNQSLFLLIEELHRKEAQSGKQKQNR